MKAAKYGILIMGWLFASVSFAQEPGPRAGLGIGYVDIDAINVGTSGIAGVNVGYGFNRIVGLDIEYGRLFSGISGNLYSAFATFTTTGNVYMKGKIGGTTSSGGSLDGGSGSLGIGIGGKVADHWVLELDLVGYSSDIYGGVLFFKYVK